MILIKLINFRFVFVYLYLSGALNINIAIAQPCNANFSFAPNNNTCPGIPIVFTPNVINNNFVYSWNFGDPASGTLNTSLQQSPSHVFTSQGTFTVCLIRSKITIPTCADTMCSVVSIGGPTAVLLDATGTIPSFTNCAAGTLQYNLLVTDFSTSALPITNYFIDWGDGTAVYNSATSPNSLPHTYNSLGYFTITYVITTQNGCRDTLLQQIFNGSNPAVGLGNPGNTIGCLPKLLGFPVTGALSNPPGTTYSVTINDGTTLSYTHPPPDTIWHTFNDASCGVTSSNGTTTFPNSFSVSITASNPCGTSSAAIVPIYISNPGSPDFSYSPNPGCINQPVTFTNTSISPINVLGTGVCDSTDRNTWTITPVTGWSVSSGLLGGVNGVPSGTDNLGITFTVPGNYIVKLVIRGTCGADSITKQICVTGPPTAAFTVNPNQGCVPLNISTVNNSSVIQNCIATNYNWVVGFTPVSCSVNNGSYVFTGGTNATSTNSTLQLQDAGNYALTLTASNVCGSTVFSQPIAVGSPPIVSVTPINSTCGSTIINPIASFDNCNQLISAYSWFFPIGVPATSNLQIPLPVTYSNSTNFPVTYTVTASAVNNCGTGTDTAQFILYPIPRPVASASPSVICLGQSALLSVAAPALYSNIIWSNGSTGSPVSVTPVNTTIYTATVTNSFGCTGTDTAQVIVNPLPIVTTAPVISVCQNILPFQITGASPVGGTWSGTGVNAAGVFNPGITGPGSYNLTYTYVNPTTNCTGSAVQQINVVAPPTLTVTSPISLCNNPGLINLNSQTNPSPAGGTWFGNFVTGGNAFDPFAAGAGTHLVNYVFTAPSSCSDTIQVTINVISPAISNAGINFSLCINSTSLQLTGSPSGGFWSGIGVSSTGLFNPALSGLGTFVLTYSYGTGNCLSQDTMTVIVNPLPIVNAGTPQSFCIDAGPQQLTGTPAGGSWSGTGINASGIFNPANATIGVNQLTYTFTDINGCTNAANVAITVNALPIVDAGINQTYCDTNLVVQLTGFTPTGGIWTGSNITAGGALNLGPLTPGNYKYYYTFTDANGCDAVDSVTVTITSPTPSNAGADFSVCINAATVGLNGLPAGGVWSGNGIAGNSFNPGAAGVGSWPLSYTYGTGSCQSVDQLLATVNPLPIVTAGSPQSFCIDAGPQQLTGTPAGGSWSGTGINASGIFNPANATVGVNQLTYTFTDINGCTNAANVAITVNALPVVDAGINQTYCDTNLIVQLTGFTPLGGIWTGSNITAVGAINLGPLTPGNYKYYYTFTDANGCDAVDSITVTITAPTPSNAGADFSICISAASVGLNGLPAGGVWSGNGITGNSFNPATAGVGSWPLSYTFGTGSCQSVDQLLAIVNPLPLVDAGLPQSFCIDAGPQQITGTPAGGSWSGTGINASGIFNPANAIVGVNQLTYTFTDINGCTNAANVAITVNALPVVNAGINQTYCDTNLIVQLTSFTPLGGIWTGSNITAGGAINLGPLTPGNYQYFYTYTDGNGCDAVDSIEVIITAPTPSNAGADFSICINAATVGLNGLPAGGVWSGSGITGNSFNPATAGVGSWPLSYTYGTGSCQSVDQLLATVNPLPIVTAGTPQSFCVDAGPQQLTGTPVSGTWSGLGVSPGGIFNPASATVGVNQLTYTFTDINGCTNAANVAITVNALPVVDAGQNLSFCDTNLVVQLTGGIPVNGIWTGSNVTPSGGLDLGPLTPGVYTYLYTFTDGNGCDEVDSIEVTITAPTPAIAGNDTVACIDASLILLNGQPAGGVWSGQGISGNNFNPLLAGVGTWTLTYTYGTGTCQTNDQIVVTVFPLPVVDAGQQVAFCIDAGVQQLNGTPTGGSWTGIAVTTAGLFDPQQAGVGSFTLYYSYSDINLCSNLDSVNVVVNALPIVNAGPDTSFCFQPISALLPTATPAGGTWTGPGVTNASTGLFDPSLAGLGTHTIIYSFFDANGCSNSDSLLVTVINPANVTAGNDTAVCINSGTFVLIGIPSGGAWSGTLIQPNGQVDPNVAGTFNLVYTYGSGTCLRRDSLSLLVNPLPVLDLTGNIQVICVDQPAFALVANPSGGTWVGPGVSGSTFNPGIAGAGNSTLIYSYTDLNGCSNVDSITITVNPLPVVFAGNDTTVCDLPSPVNFYGNFNNSGVWTGAGVNPSGVFLSPGVGTYDLVYSYTDANGCINRDTMLVTVVAPQIADAGPGDTVCVDAGSFLLPLFFPATGGTWSGPGIINSGTGLFDPALAFQNNTVTTAFTLFYSYGAGNCYTIDSTLIIIHPLPVVYAGIDIDTCISVSPFSLPGFNPFGGWWVGQGVVDSITGLLSPSVAGVGLHQLVYTYINPLTGCRNSDSLFFRVDPLPIPDFIIDTVLCVNNVYSPQNTSTGGSVWFWDFGNGVTSTLQFPSITYTAIGTYSILQVITSVEGCVDSIRKSVRVVEPPQPSFTLLPDEGCGPLEVIFTNTSSAYNPSFIWNFGNGQTDTSANPLPVTFLASLYKDTTYYITLSIANLCGSVSYTDSVLVHPSPTSYFGLNVNSGCSPLTISFSNNSYGLPTSYLWNFGDGSTSTDSLPAPHTYFAFANDTTYYITLITFNACGTDTLVDSIRVQPNTVNAFFNTNPTQGCAPLTVDFTNFSTGGSVYAWNFGDGNISSQYNATHTYLSAGLYTVSFVVTNNCSFDTAYVSIEVWPQPALAFSSSADTICAQASIGFTNTSPDPLINILWDFGDGSQSTQTSPVHSYSQPGLYLVSFIGTGSVHGCIDTIYKNILVAPLPVADFDSLLNEGCQPLNLTFTNQSTGASSWNWDFGDGNFSSLYSPSHTFLNSGSFQVNLYLETAFGCKDTSTGLVVVRPKPQSAFTISQDSACGAPATIQLTNTSTPGAGADWTFGNGQQSTQISPSVTYNQTGLFNIQLVTTNSFGCKDSAIDQFEVHVAPQAVISAADYNGCEDLLVTFINSTINGTSFYWDFGDGNTSTDVAVQHLYTDPGQYQVTLVASGAGGCVDTVNLASLITVFPGPEADFSFVQYESPTMYGIVDFFDQSIDAIIYRWDFDDTEISFDKNPTHRYDHVGTYNVQLVVYSQNGCTDTIVKPLRLNYFDGLQVPNAFAPDAGPNDALYTKFWPQGVSLIEYRLEIYDTWGTLIWSSELLIDGRPGEGWDGKRDGVDLPADVYIWKIDAKSVLFEDEGGWDGQKREEGVKRHSGTVTLIR